MALLLAFNSKNINENEISLIMERIYDLEESELKYCEVHCRVWQWLIIFRKIPRVITGEWLRNSGKPMITSVRIFRRQMADSQPGAGF